jgi:ABC-type sugar transport system substrate-binding protein
MLRVGSRPPRVWCFGSSLPRPPALALAAALAAALAGCSQEAFVPPPPPELNALPDTSATVAPTAPAVDMILPGGEATDRAVWEAAARQEAGRAKLIFGVARPGPDEPPSAQAGLIRRTAARGGALALIVEPADDPAVAEAIRDVRAKGTPVVLLGRRPTPGDPAAPPVASVTFEPFEPVARKLVKALLDEARAAGLPADSHALIAYSPRTGPETVARAKLLEEALRAAGVPDVQPVPFEGEYQAGSKALTDRLQADPKAHLLVGVDDVGLTSVLDVFNTLKASRTFSLVGGTTVDRTTNINAINAPAMIFDRNVPTLARQAVRLARSLAQGEPPPKTDVEVPLPLHSQGSGLAADRAANAAAYARPDAMTFPPPPETKAK